MATIYDVNASELIKKAGNELKKSNKVQIPEWAKVVKTSSAHERVPTEKDWWQMRAASILRKVYLKGPIGVEKLRAFYGKKKNRGVRPEEFRKGSGKIIRVVLQQLEAEGYIKSTEKGIRKGKVITPKGQSFLDKLAKKDGHRGTKKAEAPGTAERALPKATPGTDPAPGTS